MKNIIKISILLFLITTSMFSQSGWDIKYNSVNLLNESFVNTQIFIDFKSNQNDNFEDTSEVNAFFLTLEARKLLSTFDEIELSIPNQTITFIEAWDIAGDMGFLDYQSYVNVENDGESLENIYLTGINGNILFLRGDFYTSNSNFTTIEFEVSKDKVKGFLTKL